MSVAIKSFTYRHPDREILFKDLDFAVSRGEKAALVGNNGSGKSTLLQVIAGRLQPVSGEVTVSEKAYYVPQHLGQYDHFSIAEALMVEKKRRALHAILQGDASPVHFANLDDSWDIEEKVRAALSFWDLEHFDLKQKMGNLSGGEKTKVFLAGILIHEPGVILLDEPSNHLDAPSRDRFYDWLANSEATVLVVSHDRTLLNLLDVTLELSSSGIELFGGNYTFYRQQKEGKLNALESQLHEQDKMLKQARQKERDMAAQRQKKEVRERTAGRNLSIPRIAAGNLQRKAQHSTARLQEVHREKVQDMTNSLRQTRAQILQYQVLKINLRDSALHEGKMLINAVNINFSYEGRVLWQPLSFQVRSGDRIRIEGPNGSGKTTLLKLIMGNFRHTSGEIAKADFSYLYLDQDYTLIEGGLTVFEQVQRYNSRNLAEHELKSLLNYSQLPFEAWGRKGADLSGGEKMKLALC